MKHYMFNTLYEGNAQLNTAANVKNYIVTSSLLIHLILIL